MNNINLSNLKHKISKAKKTLSPRGKKKNEKKTADEFAGAKKKAKETVESATISSNSGSEKIVSPRQHHANLCDTQPAKLKGYYSARDYASINKIDREAFYDGFFSVCKKYPLVENGNGGLKIFIAKGISATDAKDEMVEFIKAEIKKPGAQFRWPGEIFMALSAITMAAARHGSFNVDDWLKISAALHKDPDFNAWKASKESGSSMVNVREKRPQSNGRQIKSAPVSPREPHDSEISPEFCKEFAELLAAHAKKSGHDGRPYVPGEGGRSYLKAFVSGELRRNPDLSGWGESEKNAFGNLSVALQDENSNFDPQHWLDFREVIEKNKAVRRHLTSSRRENQTIVAQPLKFENPQIATLLNPDAYSAEMYLLASCEHHFKTSNNFADALGKVVDDAQKRRPDITKQKIYDVLGSHAQYFDMLKASS